MNAGGAIVVPGAVVGNHCIRLSVHLSLCLAAFFSSAFLQNCFLCWDHVSGDVFHTLVRPCFVALGWTLDLDYASLSTHDHRVS